MRHFSFCFALLLGCDDGGGLTFRAGQPEADAVPMADGGPPDATRPDPPDAALPDVGPPPAPEGNPRFAFPIAAADRSKLLPTPIFGVDHDPTDGERARCTNYAGRGFPLCYDTHDGTDFVLQGGFTVMDRGSAMVVAAAGGVVIEAEDGHYDRCHASTATQDVSCDGNPMVANRVKIRHFDGWQSWYWHLKSGSVLVAVGDRVTCGAPLGLVGSSGYSSFPHLHFEVRTPEGPWIDPFAGPFSQPESLWAEQVTPDGLPSDVCDRAWGAATEE